MNNNVFNYSLSEDTIVFTDTIKSTAPCIFETPRNHESLFFVTNGNALYENEGTSAIIKENQIGYIQRGSIDKCSAYMCDAVSYIAINFNFDKISPRPENTLPLKSLCSSGKAYEYKKLFIEALNSFRSETPGHMTICNGIIMQIIGSLYNEHNMDVSVFHKMHRIESAVEYLKINFSNPELKISDLASKVYMSEKNFRRMFFQVYKQTPYTFLQKFRIGSAEILLLNTAKNISEIAQQCGFSDVYSFSHCFKKHTGISPTEYKAHRI